MQQNETVEAEFVEENIIPVESPETETGQMIAPAMGDDEFLAAIEKSAENAMRIKNATMKILVSISFPGDWVDHDGTACLSSAGAERYLKHFNITFGDVKFTKQSWRDDHGEAYRYNYYGTASLNGRTVFSQGAYSTRDKFLGYTSAKGWRSIHDIKEAHIMQAAYHMFMGNCIKCLLGLRGMPVDELKKYITENGGNPNIIKTVGYDKGSQGGKASGSQTSPQEQAEKSDKVSDIRKMLDEMDGGDPEQMNQTLYECSKFTGNNGQEYWLTLENIADKSPKWIGSTYRKVKEKYDKWNEMVS